MNTGQTGACGKTCLLGFTFVLSAENHPWLVTSTQQSPSSAPLSLTPCGGMPKSHWGSPARPVHGMGSPLLPPSPQRMDPHVCSRERNVSPSFPAMQQPAAPPKCLRRAQLARPGPCFVPGPCKHVSYSSLTAWESSSRDHSPAQLDRHAWARGYSRAHPPASIPRHASPCQPRPRSGLSAVGAEQQQVGWP